MKILAIAVALVVLSVAETAVACPACKTRVGQPMAFAAPAPMPARHHHLLRRPHGHHQARAAYVPWAMPTTSQGCGGCGSGCGVSPYIARPCGCGSAMPSYPVATGCSSGCGSTGYGMTGHSMTSHSSSLGGIRRCVPVSSGPGGQTVMRCYRLVAVPKGTPGALTYQQVMAMTQGATPGAYGTGAYGAGAYGAGGYGAGSMGSGGYGGLQY